MSADAPARLHLFEGFGIEIEYMIVGARTFDVLPVCDEVLRAVAGEYVSEVERGDLEWSNELVLHVIELKTGAPPPSLVGLGARFQEDVARIESILEPLGGRLMPTAMHPWMDPHTEARLWPHEYNAIYTAFNRIFDCRGHGWSNLQSTHINLPFCGDEEFGRLHAAIRLVLPILPGIAASSPAADGRLSGVLDSRLDAYGSNARRIPSVTGGVIPEPVFSRADYESVILARMYRDIAPHDPDGVLQHEWLNARGAIARFDRDTIEIRLLDVQECPAADLAVAALVASATRALVEERWIDYARQQRFPVEPLREILCAATREAEAAVIENRAYLDALGCSGASATIAELWRHIAAETLPPGAGDPESTKALEVILTEGSLARRICRALGADPSRETLARVYHRLCDCLRGGRTFGGAD